MKLVRLLALGALACSGGGSSQQTVNRDTLSQRQKDSILAQSKIPGASGVGRAMTAADSTSARVHATDTVGNGP
jgi:hypothetical protein